MEFWAPRKIFSPDGSKISTEYRLVLFTKLNVFQLISPPVVAEIVVNCNGFEGGRKYMFDSSGLKENEGSDTPDVWYSTVYTTVPFGFLLDIVVYVKLENVVNPNK